jgi:hypothetical protein
MTTSTIIHVHYNLQFPTSAVIVEKEALKYKLKVINNIIKLELYKA